MIGARELEIVQMIQWIDFYLYLRTKIPSKTNSMKKNLAILLTSIFIFSSSCKKIDTPDEASKAVFGEWQFRSDSGGWAGSGGSSLTEENWIDISEKGIFKMYKGSKKIEKSHFTLETHTGFYNYKLVFKERSPRSMTYKVDADTLWLSEEVADGYSYKYVRK